MITQLQKPPTGPDATRCAFGNVIMGQTWRVNGSIAAADHVLDRNRQHRFLRPNRRSGPLPGPITMLYPCTEAGTSSLSGIFRPLPNSKHREFLAPKCRFCKHLGVGAGSGSWGRISLSGSARPARSRQAARYFCPRWPPSSSLYRMTWRLPRLRLSAVDRRVSQLSGNWRRNRTGRGGPAAPCPVGHRDALVERAPAISMSNVITRRARWTP